MDNRLERDALDAALNLLDRQVVDVEGLHVCKVDDLEITLGPRPRVSRVLTGPAALVPRLSSGSGHWLRRRWISLGIQYADRDVPLAFPLDVIRHVGSALELTCGREGLLDRQPRPPDGVERRRMGELIGMRVAGSAEKVLDVRVRPADWEITHLLVGPGRPGSLLGYDRGDFDGPWLIDAIVQRLHRHSRAVPWAAVDDLDWDGGRLRG